jgi:hypothetical protein
MQAIGGENDSVLHGNDVHHQGREVFQEAVLLSIKNFQMRVF